MHILNTCSPLTEHFKAESFYRHHRRLRAIRHDSQAWFCLADLSRLMGLRLDERATFKLDHDQRRMAWLQADERWEKCLVVSESGVYALLIHHYVPENRALRQWLSHEVLPALHRRAERMPETPSVDRLQWLGRTLQLLQWRNESWVRWQDMPSLLAQVPKPRRLWQRWFGKAGGKGDSMKF